MEWMEALGPFLNVAAIIVVLVLAMFVARVVFHKRSSAKGLK